MRSVDEHLAAVRDHRLQLVYALRAGTGRASFSLPPVNSRISTAGISPQRDERSGFVPSMIVNLVLSGFRLKPCDQRLQKAARHPRAQGDKKLEGGDPGTQLVLQDVCPAPPGSLIRQWR